MSYTAPTAGDFLNAFPIFAGLDSSEAIVMAALEDAARMVDDSWLSQADFTQGRMLWAAHVLTLQRHGTGYESLIQGFTSIRSGSLSLDRPASAAEISTGSLASTSYGIRFLEILRLNKPPILVV